MGIFYSLDRLIVVHYIKENDNNLIFKYYSKLVTLHGIGHAFDTDYSRKLVGFSYSGTPEFDEIYKDEVSKLYSTEVFYNVRQSWLDYHANSRREYFAECFALYFANGETKEILKTYAPKTYNYITHSVMGSKEYTFSNYIKGIFK